MNGTKRRPSGQRKVSRIHPTSRNTRSNVERHDVAPPLHKHPLLPIVSESPFFACMRKPLASSSRTDGDENLLLAHSPSQEQAVAPTARSARAVRQYIEGKGGCVAS